MWVVCLVIAVLAGCSANDDVPAPLVSNVQPRQGPAGSIAIVTGNYFCAQPVSDSEEVDPLDCAVMGGVQFGAAPATTSEYTDTSITVEVPTSAPGEVGVGVDVAGRVSNRVTFVIE